MTINTKYSGLMLLLAVSVFFFSCSALKAETLPRPLATDARIKHVVYDPNEVYTIVGVYGYQTSIEFAPDEVVKLMTIGDSIAWQPVSFQNRIFLKPVENNATTNLTVLTDKRSYYFALRSTTKKELATYLVRFTYPHQNSSFFVESTGANGGGIGRNFDPLTLNYDYQASGDKKSIKVNKVFDDGKFTYFVFNEGSEIPAIYTVLPDKTESLVNSYREGNMLVVERLSEKFTLRVGGSYLCIRKKKENKPTRLNARN